MEALTLQWDISDPVLVHKMQNAEFQESFQSPLFSAFGFRWYLIVYPNGMATKDKVTMGVKLASVPPKLQIIEVRYAFQCLERTFAAQETRFYQDHLNQGQEMPFNLDSLRNRTTLHFSANIELLAVYDIHDADVTEHYESYRNVSIAKKHEYEWRVSDLSDWEQMRDAQCGQSFRSPIFTAGGFRWNLELWPNRNDDGVAGTAQCLVLASLPPKMKTIKVRSEFRVQCGERVGTKIADFTYNADTPRVLNVWPITLRNCPSLQFAASVETIEVIDRNDDVVGMVNHETRLQEQARMHEAAMKELRERLAQQTRRHHAESNALREELDRARMTESAMNEIRALREQFQRTNQATVNSVQRNHESVTLFGMELSTSVVKSILISSVGGSTVLLLMILLCVMYFCCWKRWTKPEERSKEIEQSVDKDVDDNGAPNAESQEIGHVIHDAESNAHENDVDDGNKVSNAESNVNENGPGAVREKPMINDGGHKMEIQTARTVMPMRDRPSQQMTKKEESESSDEDLFDEYVESEEEGQLEGFMATPTE